MKPVKNMSEYHFHPESKEIIFAECCIVFKKTKHTLYPSSQEYFMYLIVNHCHVCCESLPCLS